MSETVLYDVTDGVGTITLNRPEAMNSLTAEMKGALLETVRRAAAKGFANEPRCRGAPAWRLSPACIRFPNVPASITRPNTVADSRQSQPIVRLAAHRYT